MFIQQMMASMSYLSVVLSVLPSFSRVLGENKTCKQTKGLYLPPFGDVASSFRTVGDGSCLEHEPRIGTGVAPAAVCYCGV